MNHENIPNVYMKYIIIFLFLKPIKSLQFCFFWGVGGVGVTQVTQHDDTFFANDSVHF